MTSILDWAKRLAFFGLTRGYVVCSEGGKPPTLNSPDIDLVLKAAGDAPESPAQTLRKAADAIAPLPYLSPPLRVEDYERWRCADELRALADKAERGK